MHTIGSDESDELPIALHKNCAQSNMTRTWWSIVTVINLLNRDVFRGVVIELNITILARSRYVQNCSLYTYRRHYFNSNHQNNSRVDPLHLHSLLTVSKLCALRNGWHLPSLRKRHQLRVAHVHSFCVEVSVVRHSPLLIYSWLYVHVAILNHTLQYIAMYLFFGLEIFLSFA